MPRNNYGGSLVWRWLPLVAAAMLVVCPGCRKSAVFMTDRPFYHCGAYDVWPDSIDSHAGFVVSAVGDSILQVKVDGMVVRELSVSRSGDGAMEVSTGMPVFDMLYKMESARGACKRYSSLTPYELYLNPLCGDQGVDLLEAGLKNGYVVPAATRFYSWPVVNDNPQWILAACELYKITGDRRWLDRLGEVAANVAGEDFRVAYNRSTGLIGGVPRRMVFDDSWMPDWMGPADLLNSSSLTVNAAYWGALKGMESITVEMARKNEKSRLPDMPLDADDLRHQILRYFWMPNVGMMGGLCYGSALWPVCLKSADNFGQALAVVTGMLSGDMRASMMGKTPGSADRVGLFTPMLSAGEDDPAMLRATHCMWAVAAARSGNAQAYAAAIGAMLCDAASDAVSGDSHRWGGGLAALVVRGLLGMRFECDGINFAPVVPKGMPGKKEFKGIKYRDCVLNVSIEGVGDVIGRFMVDGVDSKPFLASTLSGKHEISITLAGGEADKNEVTPAGHGVLPLAPEVEWMTPHDATITRLQRGNTSNSLLKSFVYLNGVVTDEVLGRHYRMYQAERATAVQITTMEADRYEGFSSRPYLYMPDGKVLVLSLSEWASTGTRVIEDRVLADRFVETSKWKNRVLRIDFDVASEGDYAIDARYLDGLGIVNTRRRTALRSVDVDGERLGVWVFPQLCVMRRGSEPYDDWQSHTAFTNPLKVHLTAGHHVLEMRIYQPNPVYIDPPSNVVLSDVIRIYEI